MKNFNWEDFKNGKIVVHCDTEEIAHNFMKECNKEKIYANDGKVVTEKSAFWHMNKENTCYLMIKPRCSFWRNLVVYNIKNLKDGRELISWEIDTMKEYTFKEVIANIKEGETWESDLKIIVRGKTDITISFKNLTNFCSMNFDDDTLYKLQRKEVSFQEAFGAYEEGKEIESKKSGYKYKRINSEDLIYCEMYKNWARMLRDLSMEEIRGAWYIND